MSHNESNVQNEDYKNLKQKFGQDLDQNFSYEVIRCTSMTQVFQVIGKPGAEHFAVLTESSEPIGDMFQYVKELLDNDLEVPIALFYPKESA